jgi:hypothetical protein
MLETPPSTPRETFKKFAMVAHHEIAETFVDQLGTITFDGNTLRLELAVARMKESHEGGQATGERHMVCRLVLSTPCAIDLINQMQGVAAQLTATGLIQKNPIPPPNPGGKS